VPLQINVPALAERRYKISESTRDRHKVTAKDVAFVAQLYYAD